MFRTLLLLTTLFRLALEVSATRLIMLRADGGEVIRAFGNFVVAGNLYRTISTGFRDAANNRLYVLCVDVKP